MYNDHSIIMLTYQITNKKQYLLPDELLQTFAQINDLVQQHLKIAPAYFYEVHFISPYQMRKLHLAYKNVSKTTDVLSFSNLDLAFNQGLLGEIFICYDYCCKQANKYAWSWTSELALMYVHGLLHLLGYDHIEVADAQVMHQYEQLILSQVISERYEPRS